MVTITPFDPTQQTRGITIATARQKFIEKATKKKEPKKKKAKTGKGFRFGIKLRSSRRTRALPRVRKATSQQIRTTLQSRREQTAQRILQSNAPPIAKERARRMLQWEN